MQNVNLNVSPNLNTKDLNVSYSKSSKDCDSFKNKDFKRVFESIAKEAGIVSKEEKSSYELEDSCSLDEDVNSKGKKKVEDKDLLEILLRILFCETTKENFEKDEFLDEGETLKGDLIEDLSSKISDSLMDFLKKSLDKEDINSLKDKERELYLSFKENISKALAKINLNKNTNLLENVKDTLVNSCKELDINLHNVANRGENVSIQEQIAEFLKAKLSKTSEDNKVLSNFRLDKNDNDFSLKKNINPIEDKSKDNLKEDFSKSYTKDYEKGKNVNEDKGKEFKFLKSLTENEKSNLDTKFDKVVNLMKGINGANNNIGQVKDNVDKILINRENFVNDVIKSVRYMEGNNLKEMTVKLVPRELGEVIIKLTMENGLMKANITANNKEAYNLLNSNLQELSDKLANQQIKIQNFTIDIYNGDTTFFSRENSKESNGQWKGQEKSSTVSKVVDEVPKDDEERIFKENTLNAFV